MKALRGLLVTESTNFHGKGRFHFEKVAKTNFYREKNRMVTWFKIGFAEWIESQNLQGIRTELRRYKKMTSNPRCIGRKLQFLVRMTHSCVKRGRAVKKWKEGLHEISVGFETNLRFFITFLFGVPGCVTHELRFAISWVFGFIHKRCLLGVICNCEYVCVHAYATYYWFCVRIINRVINNRRFLSPRSFQENGRGLIFAYDTSAKARECIASKKTFQDLKNHPKMKIHTNISFKWHMTVN